MIFINLGMLSVALLKEAMNLSQENMSKKLKQAVQHANETNPTSRARTAPNTSKKVKTNSNR